METAGGCAQRKEGRPAYQNASLAVRYQHKQPKLCPLVVGILEVDLSTYSPLSPIHRIYPRYLSVHDSIVATSQEDRPSKLPRSCRIRCRLETVVNRHCSPLSSSPHLTWVATPLTARPALRPSRLETRPRLSTLGRILHASHNNKFDRSCLTSSCEDRSTSESVASSSQLVVPLIDD